MRTLFGAILVLCLLVIAWPMHAQDGDDIQYNDPVVIMLTPGQTVTRGFNVWGGDTVEIKLSRLAQYTYTAVLIDPNGLATPLMAGADGNTIYLIQNAPLGGHYALALQASSGSGELLIQINSQSVPPLPLAFGQTVIDVGTESLRYQLDPLAEFPDTALIINALALPDALAATLPGITLVNATNGHTALIVLSGSLPSVSALLPPGTPFLLVIEPGPASQQIEIVWSVAVTTTFAPVETATPEDATAEAGPCQMVFNGVVNIRSGPGVQWDPPIGRALAGETLLITGHNGDYSWYQVSFDDQLGWVSGLIDASEVEGDCRAIPVAVYPPPNTPPTAIPTPTETPTPVQPPEASPDDSSNGVLAVPLDGQAQASDLVSYPDGDTEDVVVYDVSGLDTDPTAPGGRANLQIDLLCSGMGAEYIQFVIDGQTYTCGQRFTREVTFGSRTGSVRIKATGGTGTYVQWTLAGQAPRVN